MELIFTLVFFGLSFAAMGLGVIVSNRALRGSCGGIAVADAHGDAISCGACPKSERSLCPSDEPLVQLAQIGHPDPKHHR